MSAFTEREMKIMANAWQCFAEQPKINFDKLAELSGFTNVKSASNAWSQIKKKLAAQADGVSGGANEVAVTPKSTPRKRARKADDDDSNETPSKKAKGSKAKATPKKAKPDSDVDEDEDDDPAIKSEEQDAEDEEFV